MSNNATIFSVQDETGTVTQVTLLPSPSPSLLDPIAIGDTGIYAGFPDDGTSLNNAPTFKSLPFTVSQVLDNGYQFSVATTNANLADWPATGQITWQTGANEGETSPVIGIDGANAYITTDYLLKYLSARGIVLPDSVINGPVDVLQAAIVQGTDYLDQKYRFNGVKLLQQLGNTAMDANVVFLESWLTPFALNSLSYLTPSVSTQTTEWPRQGVVDFNGNTINGIPPQIKKACAELAWRVLNGVVLQPDFDPGIVGAGGVVSQVSKEVGPLKTSISYDTKLGLGFFASFPQVDRMLSRAGLLLQGGGRTVMR